MSFSAEIKQELCRSAWQHRACARAEAYGVLLYANCFTAAEIRIITENAEFAARLPKLFQKAFSVSFDTLPERDGRSKQTLCITQPDKLAGIIGEIGYDPGQSVALHVNFGLLEEDCCRASFLRGAFLSGGSVIDPNKRYHMEFVTPHLQAGRELEALLRDMGYEPKSLLRKGNHVAYFKQSENIEDLLTLLGAPVAAMEIMSAKVEKGLRNSVNRRVNCDAANLDKTVAASREQVEAITRLTNAGVIGTLPAKLQEVAVARLLQPECTLNELAESFDPPITKSCLNHRMRKLMQLAGDLSAEKEKKHGTG